MLNFELDFIYVMYNLSLMIIPGEEWQFQPSPHQPLPRVPCDIYMWYTYLMISHLLQPCSYSTPLPSSLFYIANFHLFHFFSSFLIVFLILTKVHLRKLSRCWITGSRELLVHSINLFNEKYFINLRLYPRLQNLWMI